MGYCFLANNIIDYAAVEKLPLKYKVFDRPKSLQLLLKTELLWKYEMYVHSPEDLPYFNAISFDSLSDATLFSYSTEEIYNSVDVIKEHVWQRRCKFPNEKPSGAVYPYSFSTCMTDIRIQLEMETCNCTLFTSPYKYAPYYCDIKGLTCLSEADIATRTKETAIMKNACYPSCVEELITFLGSKELTNRSTPGFSFVEIEITNTPTIRYTRRKVLAYLDVVVSVGGVIGLFLGASLLNLADLLYICICEKKEQ